MSVATDVIAVSLAGGSLLISGWAGWTAHTARQWQRERDEERRTTRVRVTFGHARTEPRQPSSAGVSVLWASPNYTLTLTVINEGESTEYVTVAFIEQATDEEGRQGVRVFGDEGHEGSDPHELRPRGALRAPTDLNDDQLAFLRDGFVGIVCLGSGEEVRSDVEYLHPNILDALERR